MPLKLLLLHGWAFDASFWDAVSALLPDFARETDDRGYFGSPRRAAATEPVVLIGHSLGAMRALAEVGENCRGLVAINGFDRFTAGDAVPGIAVRVLDRMLARLERAPDRAVADFRAKCGSDAEVGACNDAPLREDLLMLRDGDVRAQTERAGFPILSLQGARDPILHGALRRIAFAQADRHESVTHPDAGHSLPLTHARWCADAIRAFIGSLA